MRLTAALFMSSVLLSSAVGPVLAQSVIDNLPPVTKEMLANPPAGDWVSYGHNTLNWRYSELDQINVDNAKGLQLVWARALDPGVVQSNALELNGVIFIPNPGDVIQAVNAVTGDLIWEYRRELPDRSTLQALGERKRGIALYEDKVIFSSWDNFIVALDAKTGQLAWETDRGGGTDLIMSATGPVIADGVVVTGSSCQFSEFACYVTGHDANTGEELWRNELIPRPGQEGDETWGASSFDQRWMTGVWGQLTYDPVLDMVYYGSSGAGPASEVQRNTVGGSLAGTNTRWAVKPKTGEVVWKHQVRSCARFFVPYLRQTLIPSSVAVCAAVLRVRAGVRERRQHVAQRLRIHELRRAHRPDHPHRHCRSQIRVRTAGRRCVSHV